MQALNFKDTSCRIAQRDNSEGLMTSILAPLYHSTDNCIVVQTYSQYSTFSVVNSVTAWDSEYHSIKSYVLEIYVHDCKVLHQWVNDIIIIYLNTVTVL